MKKLLVILVGIWTIVLYSCQKQETFPISKIDDYGPYPGKLSRCQVIDSFHRDTSDYYFFYDTLTGFLRRVSTDTFDLLIEDDSPDEVNLHYYINSIPATYFIRKVILNPDKTIHSIKFQNTEFEEEVDIWRCVRSLDQVDTVWWIGNYPNSSNVYSYDHVFDGYNFNRFLFNFTYYIGHYHATIYDSSQISYTSFLIDTIALSQGAYYLAMDKPTNALQDPFYILGLNGYRLPFVNSNLIASRMQLNLEIDYQYTYHTNNKLSEMRLRSLGYVYRFSYY